MKIAKIFVPLALLSLVGIIIAMVMFNQTANNSGPAEDQLAFGLTYIFLLIFTIIPMGLFIPFGLAIIICWICMLAKRNNYPSLTGALVLMCLLLPLVLFTSIYSLMALAQYSTAFLAIVAGSAALYLASLIAVIVAHVKERKAR